MLSDITLFDNDIETDTDIIDLLIINGELLKTDKLLINYILSIDNGKYKDDKNLKNTLILMFININSGNVCLKLSKDSIEKKFSYINDNDNLKTKIDFNILIEDILNKANNPIFKSIISSDINNSSIMIYKDNYLYFIKYYLLERSIENLLLKFINKEPREIDTNSKTIIKKVIKEKIINEIQEYQLNERQKIAIILSFLNSFMIISGGPGTGKTTIVAFLLKILFIIDNSLKSDDIALIAPTGSAAERMKSSINGIASRFVIDNNFTEEIRKKIEDIAPSTIHKLLKYKPKTNSFYYNSENKLNKKVFIVDEVSMIDLSLMNDLLSAIEDETKIIFLGDKNQLPSINVGTIFFNLVGNDIQKYSKKIFSLLKNEFNLDLNGINIENNFLPILDKRVNLVKNNRSIGNIDEIASLIVSNSKTENNFDKIVHLFIKLDNYLFLDFKNGFKNLNKNKNSFFIDLKNGDLNFRNKIETFLDCYFISIFSNNDSDYFKIVKGLKNIDSIDFNGEDKSIIDSLFDFISNYRILSTMRKGYGGTNFINEYLIEEFKKRSKDIGLLCYPIVITQNDYYNNLFNGDLGLVLENRTRKIVIFRKDNNYKIYHKNSLVLYEESFATTVHKSQGNEYKNVLFFIPDNSPLLSKEILYTAITRAKSKLFIVGDINSIKQGLEKEVEKDNNIVLSNRI